MCSLIPGTMLLATCWIILPLVNVVVQGTNSLDFPVSLATLSAPARVTGSDCDIQTQLFHSELKKFTLWAVQMFDASAKLPSGILFGKTHALGSYDQCLLVGRGEVPGPVLGRYCLARVQIRPSAAFSENITAHHFLSAPVPPQGREPRIPAHEEDDPNDSVWTKIQRSVMDPSKRRRDVIWWGVCLPSSCGMMDAQSQVAQALAPLRETLGIEAMTHVERCEDELERHFSVGAIIVISIFVFFLLLVTFCTAYDIIKFVKSKKHEVWQADRLEEFILCFSLYRNLKRLTSSDADEHHLKCMHGIKLYSMACVMLGHRLMFSLGSPLQNPEFVEGFYRRLDTMILLNGFILVDSFFTISGFLVCYMLITAYDQGVRVPIPALYLHRFLRLTPVYALVVGVYATLLPLLGNGPIWASKVGVEVERCTTNWWTNLLYINNYVHPDAMCMFQSWYVACDMQLFIVSVPIVYLLWKRPRVGQIVLAMAGLISVALPLIITIVGKLDALLLLYMNTLEDPIRNETFRLMYAPTHVRGSPYFVGMAFGYLTFLHRTRRFQLSRNVRFWCWLFLSLLPATSMLCAWIFYLPGRDYDALEAALYGALHRVGWSLGISWVVYAVCTGGKGVVKLILSLKPVIALSRLTYCAFLSHAGLQLYSVASMRVPAYVGFFPLAWMTLGDILMAFAAGAFLCLVFESPIQGLEKVIFRRKVQEKRSADGSQEDTAGSSSNSGSSDTRQSPPSSVSHLDERSCSNKSSRGPCFTTSTQEQPAFLGIPRAHYCNVISGSRGTVGSNLSSAGSDEHFSSQHSS